MQSIGDRIKYLRESLDLRQKDLADKTGITEATLSRYENNLREPKGEIVSKLAKALDVSSNFLLEGTIAINESELSPHEQIALKIAKALEKDGLEYTEDIIPEIVTFSEYLLKRKKEKEQDK